MKIEARAGSTVSAPVNDGMFSVDSSTSSSAAAPNTLFSATVLLRLLEMAKSKAAPANVDFTIVLSEENNQTAFELH